MNRLLLVMGKVPPLVSSDRLCQIFTEILVQTNNTPDSTYILRCCDEKMLGDETNEIKPATKRIQTGYNTIGVQCHQAKYMRKELEYHV